MATKKAKPQKIPPVPAAPAPWLLTGNAYIVLLRADETDTAAGPLGMLMFVDYTSSDVGPYHEILYIPGRFEFGSKSRWSITDIFVSTWDSVVNGQRNWGIPKDRADFEVTRSNGIDEITISKEGKQFAHLQFKPYGPRLPIMGALAPAGLRTLAQVYKKQVFEYAPSANGGLKFARTLKTSFDGSTFPDISDRILATFYLQDFVMNFPVAKTTGV